VELGGGVLGLQQFGNMKEHLKKGMEIFPTLYNDYESMCVSPDLGNP